MHGRFFFPFNNYFITFYSKCKTLRCRYYVHVIYMIIQARDTYIHIHGSFLRDSYIVATCPYIQRHKKEKARRFCQYGCVIYIFGFFQLYYLLFWSSWRRCWWWKAKRCLSPPQHRIFIGPRVLWWKALKMVFLAATACVTKLSLT